MYVHMYVLYAMRVSDGKVQREGGTESETVVPLQVRRSVLQSTCMPKHCTTCNCPAMNKANRTHLL